jgi:hypothetical protein
MIDLTVLDKRETLFCDVFIFREMSLQFLSIGDASRRGDDTGQDIADRPGQQTAIHQLFAF